MTEPRERLSRKCQGAGARERPPRAAAVLEGVPGRLELGPKGREGQKSFFVSPTLEGDS